MLDLSPTLKSQAWAVPESDLSPSVEKASKLPRKLQEQAKRYVQDIVYSGDSRGGRG